MRARDHLIQAEWPFHYHLLSAGNVDVIKQSAGCNQFTTPTLAAAGVHRWQRLGHTVAAADAGDGGGADRPCLDAARGAALSRPTVAPASRGVSTPRWWEASRQAGLRRRHAAA
jgi:hypothetical protein